ncbi:MAG: glycoside hydrolase family 3 protein [Spirochaetaceae bacterium]|jgi:beta-N-acetylhexosaminidase|nr:glycoside hydrolase family 3 protein [Spirochaetaceae bacterium]
MKDELGGMVFCAVLLLLAASAFGLSFTDKGDSAELSRELVAAMSDEDALAQTFMLGWVEMEAGPSALIQEWIARRHIGGVKVFGWNTADGERLARTVGAFQRSSMSGAPGVPLFVATDQEGGLVRHVKDLTSDTPGAMAIGASGFPEDAYRAGLYIGRELALLGINMNFAPAVDLYTNHRSLLISSRSFGDDPTKAGILGAAFARGQLAAGIVPTAKHFPGHGDTALDSHGVLPRIGADFETLWERELVPYRMLAKEGIPAIMSGHIAFPNTQAGTTPASLSPYFLGEVLRDRIGFRGLVITDDLSMNGATSGSGSLWITAKDALLAGNDLIMMSRTPALDAPIWVNLLDAMRKEPAFRARVRDAAGKILEAKLEHLRGGNAVPPVPDLNKVRAGVPDQEGVRFFQDLAARSVTIIEKEAGLFPIPAGNARRILLAGQNLDFFAIGRLAYPAVPRYWYTAPASGEFLAMARAADIVIFYLETEEGIDVLRAIRPLGKKLVVLSVLSPAYLEAVPWVDGAVAVYSNSHESLVAGFSAILGKIGAAGALPFTLRPRN